MADITNTLLVRHLPAELSTQEQEDLLKHFGATHVKCMNKKGRLKYAAFAAFKDKNDAERALKRLHQLEVLGCKLVVEFSKAAYEKYHPSVLDYKKVTKYEEGQKKVETEISKDAERKRIISENINKMAPNFGLDYPMNPKLQYMYPPPSVSILTNIANALASVPKFYVQVLHLMNKMNLPAPFRPVLPTPPLADDANLQMDKPGDDAAKISSEESELESEEEESKIKISKKRQKIIKDKPRKRPKLHVMTAPVVPLPTAKTTPQIPTEVFEQLQSTTLKKIEFKLSAAIADVLSAEQELEETNEVAETENIPNNPEEVVPAPVPSTQTGPPGADLSTRAESQIVVEKGGFGKIKPKPKVDKKEEPEEKEEEWGEGEFISSRQLRKGRLSKSEMRDLNVFKRYEQGDPTSRLYIKNLAKQVTDKDLHYIYGRYVDWKNEEEKLRFDIRHMKEGRMKGQAFITLPNETGAKEALQDTLGFMLHGRPMVVSFSRSAKPKDKDDGKK